MSKRILIIEDSDYWQKRYREELPSELEIVQANNFETAETEIQKLITGSTTFDAIVFDTCLQYYFFDTGPLVQKVKKSGFTGHMIATSTPSDAWLSRELQKIGCTRGCNKYTLSYALLQLLAIKQSSP